MFLFLDLPTLKLRIIIILPTDRPEIIPKCLYNKKLSCPRLNHEAWKLVPGFGFRQLKLKNNNSKQTNKQNEVPSIKKNLDLEVLCYWGSRQVYWFHCMLCGSWEHVQGDFARGYWMTSSLKMLKPTRTFTINFYRGAVIEALMKEKQKGNLKGIYGRLVWRLLLRWYFWPIIFTKVLWC